MMDELETYIHARWAQVSVPIAVRVKTGTILGFDIAPLSSNMKKGQQMGWNQSTRHLAVPRLLKKIAPLVKPGGTIATDGDSSYGKWVFAHLPGVKHNKLNSPKKVSGAYDPLHAINVVHPKSFHRNSRYAAIPTIAPTISRNTTSGSGAEAMLDALEK